MTDHMLPVRKQDLQLGQPVPYAIFDAQGQLLISAGQVIRNADLLATLQEVGLYANSQWSRARKPAPVPSGGARVHRSPVAESEPAKMGDGQQPERRSLPDLKLQPGMWLQIGEGGAGGRPRTSVRLIGWSEKNAVFLSSLNAQGAVVPFREGETLSLKTLAGRDVVAFSGIVSKVIFSPIPYVILTYPEQIQRQQLRKAQRVDTDLIASVTFDDAVFAGRIINLSASGAMLASSTTLRASALLQLVFRLPAAGSEHTVVLKAQVRSISREEGQVGIEFVELGTQERLVIEHFIFQTLHEG